MRPFFRRHILNVPDHRIANWALTVRQDRYVLCLLSGRVTSLESLVCVTSRQVRRCSIENEFTERDQRRVLIFHVTWELMVGIMQSSHLTWGITVVLWLSPWSLIMSKSPPRGAHDIVGVKPLSHGGKWMCNKGSLTFKLFEGEYSMIWLRIFGQSMNEI